MLWRWNISLHSDVTSGVPKSKLAVITKQGCSYLPLLYAYQLLMTARTAEENVEQKTHRHLRP